MDSFADMVRWGGQVWNTARGGRHTNTQMGSGHFPKDGHTRAAFIYRCFYRDLYTGNAIPKGYTKATKPSCNDISRSELKINMVSILGALGVLVMMNE
ncbi:hypothetical protein MRB53_006731 [Persea americana]|uniref:Uncharacterized protein n=1 Tax=Persea americana TaxID=3435 RepID=A0ACC2MHX5_PERAE|nr:hypothetical protein MRB53_006731 [Persea americana]